VMDPNVAITALIVPPTAWVIVETKDIDAEAAIEASAWLTEEDRFSAADRAAATAWLTEEDRFSAADRAAATPWVSADTREIDAETTSESRAWLTVEDKFITPVSVAKN